MMKPLHMKLQIPEFIPSENQEMVWSPTSGSRPRRSSDDIPNTQSDVPTDNVEVISAVSPDVPSSQDHVSLSSNPNYQESNCMPMRETNHPSPTKEFLDHSPNRSWRRSSPLPLTDISNGQQLASSFQSSPRQFADRAHHHSLIQHAPLISNLQPVRGITGLPEEPRAPKSSVRPPRTDYPSSLSLFANPPSSHQSQHSEPAAGPATNPHYRLPLRPSQHYDASGDAAFINQLDPLTFQTDPNPYDSKFPFHYQRQILTGSHPNEEMHQIPAPGSMDPLTFWNLLYHRENTILSRLSAAGLLLTDAQTQYITMMKQMRVNAAASQLPYRGNKGKAAWVKNLERVLQEIWVLKSGQTEFSEEVIARKKDFESAVIAEIEMARMEKGRGR